MLYVTIKLSDIKEEKVEFLPNKLVFEGIGGKEGNQYAVTLEFFKEINPEVCISLCVNLAAA